MPRVQSCVASSPKYSNKRALVRWIRRWAPPGLIETGLSALNYIRPAPWEYVGEQWASQLSVRGWNVSSIVEMQRKTWDDYAHSLTGPCALGLNHEDPAGPYSGRLRDHNTLVSYAYALALCARHKERLSLLDWGGGMGHYYLLSQSVLPDTEIDYYCQDIPLLCQAGREMLPKAHFLHEPGECFGRPYDLVLASSSLWYEPDWHSLIDNLVASASPYLYVSRMIFVDRAPSYVAIQRPFGVGYKTEYLCWILNRSDFLNYVHKCSMKLVREFLISDAAHIHRAPEQGRYLGFLFRKT